MSEFMTTVKAIKTFFTPPNPQMAELTALKNSMPQDEWNKMGQACCKELGVGWTPPKEN